jgi:hypothetical protein
MCSSISVPAPGAADHPVPPRRHRNNQLLACSRVVVRGVRDTSPSVVDERDQVGGAAKREHGVACRILRGPKIVEYKEA